jgi:hypothetical protein
MSSAGSAEQAQSAGAGDANATQKYMYDTTRADNAPFQQNGVAGNNRLAYLLGIGGTNAQGQGGPVSKAQLGNTTGAWTPNATLYANSPEYRQAWDSFIKDHQAQYGKGPDSTGGSNAGALPGELASRGFDINAYNKQVGEATSGDNSYGSLLKKFDANDLNNDVVYQNGLQFGLNEGAKAINRGAAAAGSYDSGAVAKALTRFGNDYATTKTEGAYNRYEADKNNVYNKLAGISGTGQTAVNNVSSAGQNYANNVSSTQLGLGNARGASAIAQGNALSNGLVNGYNNYQQANLLNSFQNGNFGSGNINYGSGNTGSTNGGYYGGDNSYGSF